jgi:GntP family gluconate:H+ symporter
MATGAGAMTISHANDSYFWVVSQFSGLDTSTAYKTHSMATLVQGIVTIVVVSAIAAVFV